MCADLFVLDLEDGDAGPGLLHRHLKRVQEEERLSEEVPPEGGILKLRRGEVE